MDMEANVSGRFVPQLVKEGKLPPKLIGSHSLKAWGHRLGEFKGELETDWKEWSQEMSDYCKQDVIVTRTLLDRIATKALPEQAVTMVPGMALAKAAYTAKIAAGDRKSVV